VPRCLIRRCKALRQLCDIALADVQRNHLDQFRCVIQVTCWVCCALRICAERTKGNVRIAYGGAVSGLCI